MRDIWTTFDTLQWLAVILCIVAFVLLCHYCDAENLPDAIPDAPSAVAQPQPEPSTWHQLRLPLTAMWATNAADMSLTCTMLANGGHEDFLPTQSCGGAAAILTGQRAAATGLAWILTSKGHPKLAKALLWAATGSSGYAIGYTAMHWHEPIQPRWNSPIQAGKGGTK